MIFKRDYQTNMKLLEALKWRYSRLTQALKVYYLTFNKHTIELKGVKISLGKHLSNNIKEAMVSGHYESAESKMIESKLDNNDVVMELGTGIGFIASYCAKKIGSENVNTYEANPSLEPHIRKNFELNNVTPNLTMCFLSDSEGEQTFYVERDFWSSSIVRRSKDAKKVAIPIKKTNDEIRRINPSFLIVDIEGGEDNLFQHIDFHNIKKISIELHTSILGEKQISEIKNKLKDHGFEIDSSISNAIPKFKEELYFERVI